MGRSALLRRRRVGRILRGLRLRAGMTIEVAAPKLDFSPAKLSRIENADQGVDVHIVRSMLDLYGVGGSEWEEIIELTRDASEKGWWRAYGLDDKGYLPLEAEADTIRDFTVTYVPGLLQTQDYARAMFEAALPGRSAANLRRDVRVRMIRQERLASVSDPIRLAAVIDEPVLKRPVGGSAVMRAQLQHLVAAARLDCVDLQVLPARVGAHPAMGGAFTVLTFDCLGEPDMAYVEHPMGAVHIEKEKDVAQAKLVFDHLRSVAMDPSESVALIEQVVAQT